ncbi:MAG: hypothetical protein ACPGXK_01600 [Phycisphaerae bacterium]
MKQQAVRDEQLEMMVRFKNSLSKVVELGYGDDECNQAVSIMFEDMVKQAVPRVNGADAPIARKRKHHGVPYTCADLLDQTNDLLQILEAQVAENNKNEGAPVLFPFMTTLGISGGLFLISFHVTRILNAIVPGVMSS